MTDELPSLGGANEWLNSQPLTSSDLRGRVVLVDFWTYSCINWIRSLPYVRAWSERYARDGLVVIGVHTPEFAFEHDVENVRRAAEQMRVEYPIAIDSDYAIWRAFENHYWPALYFIDAQGRIRHRQFGEGDYERVHLVMGPATRGAPVRFSVRVDGQAPGAVQGLDIDEGGQGTVTDQRLYQLIRQRGDVAEHTLEVTFLDRGVELYVFTFG
jgi:thiol-disulfide isomerase/thioredoxin